MTDEAPIAERIPYSISSLGRIVDPHVPSNRWVMLLQAIGLIVGSIYGVVNFGNAWDAVGSGLELSFSLFFAWALGRELDPDRHSSAFVCALLVAIGWFVLGGTDLWPLAAATGLARIVNRTVGPPCRATDSIGLCVVVLVAMIGFDRWATAVTLVFAFALDGLMPNPHRRQLGFAAITLAAFVGYAIWRPIAYTVPHLPWAAMTLLVIATAVLIVTLPELRSSPDVPGHALVRPRVQGGVFVTLLLVVTAQFEPYDGWPASGVALALVGAALSRMRGPSSPHREPHSADA